MSSLFKPETLTELFVPAYFDHNLPFINYGTAGYRTVGEHLPPIAYRSAFVILVRSLEQRLKPHYREIDSKKWLVDEHFELPIEPSTFGDMGIMITASHNPAHDNGLKIVDASASNLIMEWEEPATELCNVRSMSDFVKALHALIDKKLAGIPDIHAKVLSEMRHRPIRLHVGRDTRPNGNPIFAAIVAGVETINKNFETHGLKTPAIALFDHGILTTPTLHGNVFWGRHLCSLPEYARGSSSQITEPSAESETLPTGAAHWNVVFGAILRLFKQLVYKCDEKTCVMPQKRHIIVDCANGVGAITLRSMLDAKMHLSTQFGPERTVAQHLASVSGLHFTLVSTSTENSDLLNINCGADYSKQKRKAAVTLYEGLESVLSTDKLLMETLASCKSGAEAAEVLSRSTGFYVLDGDADRVVSFAPAFSAAPQTPAAARADVQFGLIDGDHFSCLYAFMVNEIKSRAHTPEDKAIGETLKDVAVIQTAYANGASTHYIKSQLKLPCICTATGTKHLHHEAERKDIGIYFESNGHGTLLANPRLFLDPSREEYKEQSLGWVFQLIMFVLSQCCGDAIADMLCAEFALALIKWTPIQWLHLYDDLPSKTGTFRVKDPSVIKTVFDQTRTTAPEGLQGLIDAAVERAGGQEHLARAFVRPSGTEPVVRNYAEADTNERAEQLYIEVQKAVEDVLSKL